MAMMTVISLIPEENDTGMTAENARERMKNEVRLPCFSIHLLRLLSFLHGSLSSLRSPSFLSSPSSLLLLPHNLFPDDEPSRYFGEFLQLLSQTKTFCRFQQNRPDHFWRLCQVRNPPQVRPYAYLDPCESINRIFLVEIAYVLFIAPR